MDSDPTNIYDGELFSQLTIEEKKKLACSPGLSEFQRNKLEEDSKKNWDLFYKRNGDRFYKNRYWTRHEFHELFVVDETTKNKTKDDNLRYLFEVGCGCGNFALPLLYNDEDSDCKPCHISLPNNLFIYCCDISEKAVEILKSNPIYKKNNPSRIHAFTADITKNVGEQKIQENIHGRQMDIVSLIFVLSALDPVNMKKAAMNVNRILKPGGLVLFRDYAIYDKAMLRFSENSKISDQFYVRQDGTRAYFFTKKQLTQLFEQCNFHCQSIDYVRLETVNNATKDKYSRIFLQAKFNKVAE